MLRAVIFDLDGTLVDSLEDIAVALDLALDDHDVPRPTRAIVRTWIGSGARNLIAQAIERAHGGPDQERTDAVLARFRHHYAAAPVVHTKLYPGLARVLDTLVAADQKLAVCSNKPQALTSAICDVLLARWPFGAVIGQREHVPLKPSPAPALETARLLDVAPEACAFVGDSAIDVLTAQAARMVPVAVSWGFRPRTELAAAAPALLADTAGELAQLATWPSRT